MLLCIYRRCSELVQMGITLCGGMKLGCVAFVNVGLDICCKFPRIMANVMHLGI